MNESDAAIAMDPLMRVWMPIADALPRLAMAALVLLLGLVLSAVVRRVTTTLARRSGFDALAERLGVARLLYAIQLQESLGAVLGRVAMIATLLVSVALSAEIAGLPGVTEGIGAVLEFLPRLVSAAIVMLVGLAAADFASRVAENIGRKRSDLVAPALAGKITYGLIAAVTIATAVQHIGIDTNLVDSVVIVVIGSALGATALAMAWASRDLIQNVLCRPYVMAHLEPGAKVVYGETTGVVLEAGAVSVTLEAADGSRCVIPYRALLGIHGFRVGSVD